MSKSGNCKLCGRYTPTLYGDKCQSCYRYFFEGGKVYPKPEPGRIVKDPDGRPICHICGKSFKKLGAHTVQNHGLTIDEYKQEFGLCANARTTEAEYSSRMRDSAYIHNMPNQLILNGKMTRIKPGENDKRKNKPVRLQEVLNKRDRKKDK